MLRSGLASSGAVLSTLLVLGCASEVIRHPVSLAPITVGSSDDRKVVRQDVPVKLDTGYERIIRKDSTWQLAGTVRQGKVYRPENGAFSVEGAHVHEAYIVVIRGRLIGFYLPVERAFSAVNQAPLAQLWEDKE